MAHLVPVLLPKGGSMQAESLLKLRPQCCFHLCAVLALRFSVGFPGLQSISVNGPALPLGAFRYDMTP